ncbi:hypothetical protein ACBZ91_02575 [Vibrio natriegens]|uniref:hypothetical protein n=1 Tax=Vibrio natriegens TaxID=691 RepID=UPI003557139E
MEFWIIDSDNLGPVRMTGELEGVAVIAASVHSNKLPLINGRRIGKVVPFGRQASDFRLVADTAVMLASNHISKDSILRVYTCDKGLANGIRQLALQHQIIFKWHKRYDQ